MDKKIYNYVDQALPERKELLGKDSCRGDRGYVGHGAIMYRAIKICKSL
jgi:hypothetical protein